MRIFRSLEEARASFAPSAVTIGNFDGVHAAHHELMRTVVQLARECGAKPSALTFSPHPAEVVAPERAPLLLSSPAERCALMERDGPRTTLGLVEAARQAGIALTSLSVQSTTLDDVFVHYTGHQLRDSLQAPSAADSPFIMKRGGL